MSEEPGRAVFHATAAQWRLRAYLHRHPVPEPLAQTLASAGVSRASYYRWLRQPGFAAWLIGVWVESREPVSANEARSLSGVFAAAAADPACFAASFPLLFGYCGLANLHPRATPEPTAKGLRRPSQLTRFLRFDRVLKRALWASRRPRRVSPPAQHLPSLSAKNEH